VYGYVIVGRQLVADGAVELIEIDLQIAPPAMEDAGGDEDGE
jgi:hypothetical protein